MKNQTFENRLFLFFKSKLLTKTLLVIMSVFFVHLSYLLLQLLDQEKTTLFSIISFFLLLFSIAFIINGLLSPLLKQSNEQENDETPKPYEFCQGLLQSNRELELELKRREGETEKASKYRTELTNKYLQILTKNVFLKVEIKNVVKALQKNYNLAYECHKCGSVIDDFEQVEYHSEVCTIQINSQGTNIHKEL